MRPTLVGSGFAALALALACTFAGTSCSSNPINVAVRTFERAQKVDVICLHVRFPDPTNPYPVPADPRPQAECAPVPPNTDGTYLPNHLYALVTQTARGELAVVDLTSAAVVDEDHATPGINFIPVGAQPTDVAAAPDGKMVYVSAAETNKPAIYGIAATRILGDVQGLPADPSRLPLTLPTLPACLLPQAPMALAIVPRTAGAAGADAGASSGGYDLAVVLAGTGSTTAKLAIIDPMTLARGAGVESSDGGATTAPGSLTPCVVTSAIELSRDVGATVAAPQSWDDGVKYIDGGVDLRAHEPLPAPSCTTTLPPPPPNDGGAGEGGATDGGVEGGVEGGAPDASAEGGTVDAGIAPLSPSDASRPTAAAFDSDRLVLYVADGALPMIHAIDLSLPGAPRELPPLLATSAADGARKVVVSALAISPTTREFKRFLYAVDGKEGSLIVYDITTAPVAAQLPMRRPHPELNPFQPPDRIRFNAPVAAVSFVKHDWPLTFSDNNVRENAKTGLICNPNPNANSRDNDDNAHFRNDLSGNQADLALGANYRSNAPGQQLTVGPYRLRGVFGFATLSNGQMVTIDVDDWDAPCRRPDAMDSTSQTSDLAPPQPSPANGDDLDPYHVPVAYHFTQANAASPVTLEAYFPVSAPHRPRSNFQLRADSTSGLNIPNLVGIPQLVSNNAVRATTGREGKANPIMLPTFSTLADPTYVKNPLEPDPGKRVPTVQNAKLPEFALPVTGDDTTGNTTPGVRFAFEDPLVHVNQDWTVTYEGQLPGFNGIAAAVEPIAPNDYGALQLSAKNALFCRRGVEDLRIGRQRVAARNAEMDRLKIPRPDSPESWTTDYVQITDDILASDDPYWTDSAGDTCWDPSLTSATARHDACQSTYGSINDTVPSLFRDFPILAAYDDHFIIGRYGYLDPANPATVNRVVVERDPSNVAALKLARCCFHHQANFRVRTGGQWVAVGSVSGLLHHVRSADRSEVASDSEVGACVPSCDPSATLLNARAPDVPRPLAKNDAAPDRNSPLAVRNPMFAFVVWSGAAPAKPSPQVPAPGHTTSQRDYQWKFSTRGQFQPLYIAIGGNTNAVAPQSMRFIDSLGQLAVVDGSLQGLVLIDLNTVAFAHAPYF